MKRTTMRLMMFVFGMFLAGALLPRQAVAAPDKRPDKARAPEPGAVAEPANNADTNDVAAAWERIPVKYTGAEAKRDPFELPAPLAKKLEKPKELKPGERLDDGVALPKVNIQGIVWSKRMPQVILNNSVMRVGDFVEQFEIKEIKKSSIILFLKGREYEIKIQSPAAEEKTGRKPIRSAQ